MAFRTVAGPSRFVLDPIKGSRFIADVMPVSDEEQALAAIAQVRSDFADARHHCWAFRLHREDRTRSSDDGEPGGSAGRPILAQINGHELQDVCVVVTRWFGGVKLGVGGLIRAYGGCAGKALDAAKLRIAHRWIPAVITHGYGDTAAVETLVAQHEIRRGEAEYDAQVQLHIEVMAEQLGTLQALVIERTAGRGRLTPRG